MKCQNSNKKWASSSIQVMEVKISQLAQQLSLTKEVKDSKGPLAERKSKCRKLVAKVTMHPLVTLKTTQTAKALPS